MMLRADQETDGGPEELEEGSEECGTCESAEVFVKDCPELPSKLEVERHFASNHVPYRSWCKMCVMGRAAGSPHKKVKRVEDDLNPTVSMDYAYLNDQEKEHSDPVLTSVCHKSGTLSSHVIP